MATLKVETDKERDLPELQAVLTRMGLKFDVYDDWATFLRLQLKG